MQCIRLPWQFFNVLERPTIDTSGHVRPILIEIIILSTMSRKAGIPPSARYFTLLCEFVAFVHEKPKPYPKEHEVRTNVWFMWISWFVIDLLFKIHSNIIYSPRINLIISSLKMNLMQLHVSGWGYFLVLFVCHHTQYLTFYSSNILFIIFGIIYCCTCSLWYVQMDER